MTDLLTLHPPLTEIEQLRTQIVQDTLQWIQYPNVTVEKDLYCRVEWEKEGQFRFLKLEELLNSGDTSCYVCAVGALLANYLVDRRAGAWVDVTFGDSYEVGEHDCFETLKNVWSIKQLRLIENAFERSVVTEGEPQELSLFVCAADQYRDWPEPKERLIQILSNILQNRGTFVVDRFTAEQCR